MAYFGLSKPVIARYAGGTYSDGMVIGNAVGTSVTPAFAEGSLYADNREVEHRKRFKNAAVEAETDRLPLAAGKILFGHTVGTDDKSETSKTADASSYVGYGFVGLEVIDDIDKFTACWLTKVIFSEGADSLQTNGDNITFSTRKLSGTAIGDENGVWREKKTFDAEEEAYAWLKEKAGITV